MVHIRIWMILELTLSLRERGSRTRRQFEYCFVDITVYGWMLNRRRIKYLFSILEFESLYASQYT